MADTEATIQAHISDYTGQQIEAILDKAQEMLIPSTDADGNTQKSKIVSMEEKLEQLYQLVYNSVTDKSLYFLTMHNQHPEWSTIPNLEGVEI